ncbi:hypothetical protein GcC1_044012 [Golovinomyces cichoracearum]|uniref:Uncharacterized protein n=1 Tax=Golovinomyces cichoracearum TaxID=62708 RepID=A0A420IYS5_9PEZI|nr:hypothetical protein GcC1_044012 [Golovinomyces cichoracearum]
MPSAPQRKPLLFLLSDLPLDITSHIYVTSINFDPTTTSIQESIIIDNTAVILLPSMSLWKALF